VNWAQLRTLLWLRMRLSRNQWRRQGPLGGIIGGALLGLAVLLGLGSAGGSFFLGWLVLSLAPPKVLNLVCLGISFFFLVFWMVGLLVELQRSESIDLQRLMHLPVYLEQIFALNYIASHFTLSLVIALPSMMGLSLGLALAKGPAMLLLVPLWLSAVGMVTAWTYCLRGWLAGLINDPRRRRTAMVTITLLFIVVFQFPNLYFNVFQRLDASDAKGHVGAKKDRAHTSEREELAYLDGLIDLEAFVPAFWPALGAEALEEGSFGAPLLAIAGCALLSAWGLLRAYRGTVSFYRGAGGVAVKRRSVESVRPHRTSGRRTLIEARVPGLSEQASAVAVATWRSMLRAPEVKIVLGSSVVVMFLFGGMLLFRFSSALPAWSKPFTVLGGLAFTHFTAIQLISNQFGLDRDGVRTFILSPIPRRDIVLGKSVATLGVVACFGIVLLVASALGLRLSPLAFVAALFQWITMLLMVGLAGSALSILFPLRIAAGSLKPTKTTGVNLVVVVIFQLLFPLTMAPAFVPLAVQLAAGALGFPYPALLNVGLSVALAALAVFVYASALDGLGALFQRRETSIVAAVTTAVE
jgi:ABC-2 type transport system permease protein